MKKIIILFFGFTVYGQKLHHSMISAQGKTAHLANGVVVRQTIGQQSTIGNFSDSKRTVGQGFQQSEFMKSKALLSIPEIIKSRIITYPNPMVDKVNFMFPEAVSSPIKIMFFDLAGRLVVSRVQQSANNILTLENIYLEEGEYLVNLTAENYNYSTNILVTK